MGNTPKIPINMFGRCLMRCLGCVLSGWRCFERIAARAVGGCRCRSIPAGWESTHQCGPASVSNKSFCDVPGPRKWPKKCLRKFFHLKGSTVGSHLLQNPFGLVSQHLKELHKPSFFLAFLHFQPHQPLSFQTRLGCLVPDPQLIWRSGPLAKSFSPMAEHLGAGSGGSSMAL